MIHTARAVGDDGDSTFDDDVLRLLASGKNVIFDRVVQLPRIEG